MKRLSVAIGILLMLASGVTAQDQVIDSEDEHKSLEARADVLQRAEAEAITPGFETIDPFQTIWEKTSWSDPKVNFSPVGQSLPAGDLNGDGTTDLYRNYNSVPDERDGALETTTDKTLLQWGGSDISTTTDLTVYANLQPVGNLYDEGNDNAIAYDDEEEQWYIYSFTNDGFSREALNHEFFYDAYNEQHIVFNDLNNDGYDDIVVAHLSKGELYILYGGETLDDLTMVTQDVNEWGAQNQFTVNGTNLMDVYAHDGNAYIVLEVIDEEMQIGRHAVIASIDDADEPELQQTFHFSENASVSNGLMKAISVHPDEDPYLLWVFPDEALTRIFDASDTQGQLFETTPRIWVELLIKPISDIDNDGRTDFIVEEVSGDLRFMYGPQEADGRPDFGEHILANSDLEPEFNLNTNDLSAQQLRYGDLTGNGVNDHMIQATGEDRFGQVMIEGNADRNFETTELTYNAADYERTVREDTYALGDITGNGNDDFAVTVHYSEHAEVEIYEGGSGFTEPVTTIEPGYFQVRDISAGVFKETGRIDIAILGGEYTQNSDGDDIIATEVSLYAGGETIETSPYTTITDHDAHPGYDWLDSILQTLETAGDVTNSGYDDLLIGAPGGVDNQDGSIFPTVLYEGGPDIGGEPDHQILYTNRAGHRDITGYWFGNVMSGVGDVNGDGIDDFAIASPDSYLDILETDRNGAGHRGVVHVYYGSDEEGHTFDDSDVVLKSNLEDASNNIQHNYFGFSEIASGDYNGDGVNDIAVKAFHHRNNDTNEGEPGIHIFNGGAEMDGDADQMVGLLNDAMAILDVPGTYVPYMGHALMETVPDIDGSGHDELLVIGDNGFTNGVLLMGSDESIQEEPAAVLEAPNQSAGMGSVDNYNYRHFKTAMGDFTGDGFQDVAVVQRDDMNYRDTPAYLFTTGEASVATSFEFQVELFVEDNTGNSINLNFGASPDASSGADKLDQEAPPLPPSGSFDARFIQEGNGYFSVYHQPTEQQNEWTITVQPAEGEYPVALSWEADVLAEEGTFMLTSDNGDVNVNMKDQTSLNLAEGDPDTLTISHSIVNEVPAAVVLAEPADGTDLEADSLTFIWEQPSQVVSSYGFELARDAEFDDVVVDSVVNDTSFVFKDGDEETELFWRVRAENSEGWGDYSSVRSLNWIPTSMEQKAGIPQEFALQNNYPNPFNPSTVIGYQLPENSRVQLEVYDVLGKKIATLVNTHQQAGTYTVNFDASNLSSGVYIYRIKAGSYVETQKMMLIK